MKVNQGGAGVFEGELTPQYTLWARSWNEMHIRLWIIKVILHGVMWKYVSDGNWLFHIIAEWKSIYYFACGLAIPLGTTGHTSINLAHTWIMEKMKPKFRSLWTQEGNIKFFWHKQLGFCLRTNKLWVRIS